MNRLAWSTLLLLFCLCPLRSLRGDTTLDTEAVKRIVVFLYPPNSEGTDADATRPMGTGFLMSAHAKGDSKIGALMLITARHIVDPNWASCSPEPLSRPDRQIYMRLNNKLYDPKKESTGVSYLPVDLVKNGARKYLVRDDDAAVDAAVIQLNWGDWGKMQEKYDFRPMSLSVFANPDEIAKLKIGDSIASAGLVPGSSGEKRNYPFFKFGEVSNIPDEPFQVGCRTERVWFIAANLIGGNSGSPIFYSPPPYLTNLVSVGRGVLIGVQSSALIALSGQGGNNVLEPAAIAGMTPIEDVFKIIEKNSPAWLDLYRGDEAKRKADESVSVPHY
jgi:hypothetical protein